MTMKKWLVRRDINELVVLDTSEKGREVDMPSEVFDRYCKVIHENEMMQRELIRLYHEKRPVST